jgi:hypothetical protein
MPRSVIVFEALTLSPLASPPCNDDDDDDDDDGWKGHNPAPKFGERGQAWETFSEVCGNGMLFYARVYRTNTAGR